MCSAFMWASAPLSKPLAEGLARPRRCPATTPSTSIESGLLTIVGGKWTTYRHMAEDCVNHATTLGDLEDKPCVTSNLKIHGYHQHPEELGSLAVYGSDATAIDALAKAEPSLNRQLHPNLPYIAAEIVWGVREEMSRTVDDALARRTRALLLNSRAAITIAPAVARILAIELHRDQAWIEQQIVDFNATAEQYVASPAPVPTTN